MTTYSLADNGSLQGTISIPGDKSITHRALIFSSLSNKTVKIKGWLQAEDTFATLNILKQLGVEITTEKTHEIEALTHQTSGNLIIKGGGLQGLKSPKTRLNAGNSGTTMRLMIGVLAGQPFQSTLVGDASLMRRPMQRLIEPLSQMGAKIESRTGYPPIIIHGNQLKSIRYQMPIASAQVQTALALAGLYAQGKMEVQSPLPCRDHTTRLWPLCFASAESFETIHVPGDFSSAFFFIVAATVVPGSSLCLKRVNVNPTRIGGLNLLKKMGADITLKNISYLHQEPTADIEVKSATLSAIAIEAADIPFAIDEIPALCVAAACAKGKTIIRGAQELRVKESDRLQAMAQALYKLGIQVQEVPDGLDITGGKIQAACVDAKHDHRISMALSIAALRCQNEVQILNCDKVATSFPNFSQLAKKINWRVQHKDPVIEL